MLALATISTAVTNAFGGAHGTNAFETALPGGTGGAVEQEMEHDSEYLWDISIGTYSSLESGPKPLDLDLYLPMIPSPSFCNTLSDSVLLASTVPQTVISNQLPDHGQSTCESLGMVMNPVA